MTTSRTAEQVSATPKASTGNVRDGEARPPSGRTTILPRLKNDRGATRVVVERRDRFEASKALGQGAVGEVILATDNDIGRPVAIKRLLPANLHPEVKLRFAEEIRTMGLLDHPNIVPVHDVGVSADGQYYYVMKFVEGDTLEEIIDRLAAGDERYHRRFTFARRVELFRQVLLGVQYAHAQGIIHRDLKPANIMVGRFGEVLVMDWGIARRLHATATKGPVTDMAVTLPRAVPVSAPTMHTASGALLGTPAYMSPEQARGDNDAVDERSDIYALGVIFHELMTLRHYLARHETLPACLEGVQRDEVPPAKDATSPYQPRVPADLGHFIRHAVQKSPSERYRTVTAMLHRLNLIEDGQCPVECPLTLMKRASTEVSHRVDRRPMATLVAAAAAAGLCLAGIVSVVSAMT